MNYAVYWFYAFLSVLVVEIIAALIRYLKSKRCVKIDREILHEMIELLDDHCQYCADCDWRSHHPDQTCQFGRFWNKARGAK